MTLPIKANPSNPRSSFLQIRVSPAASRSQWIGVLGESHVKIALQAPANNGKANAALCKFLAKEFQINAKSVEIIKGEKNKNKTVLIPISASRLVELIEPLLPIKQS